MAFQFSFSVALLLSIWSTARCAFLVEGVLQMECHDRYFMIALDLAVTGTDPRFEAVGASGVHAITDEYAAKCGYSISILPFLGIVELRASYFRCHTEKEDDFKFNFNLITTMNGVEAFYTLNKTCPGPSLWSAREVTCEVNYMEVSVTSGLPCASGANALNSLSHVHSSSTSDWQVTFQKLDEQLQSMNLSQARKQGYMFDLLHGRIVFRTPYGQPESYRAEVNDVVVEVVHATVFSRKSWVILMVDLIAACSMDEGSYDHGYIFWKTPEALYSHYNGTQLSVGVNGNLMDQATAKQKGFIMEKKDFTIQIGVPYNTDGGYKKSVVSNGIFEFYVFNLYVKQTLIDEHHEETMLQFHRTLVTPLLPHSLVTEDRTVVKEGMFTLYLGDVPEDIELISLQLNGETFEVPLSDKNTFTLAEVVNSNKTHSYTLKVLLRDPVVIQQFSKKDKAMLHILEVNYTLIAVPENEPYYHTISTMVLMDVSPPAFNAVCNQSGISFTLHHQSSDYLWDISIGPDRLTPDLAAKRGYIMNNDDKNLLLYVPLFTYGYKYRGVTLKGFLGTFEILVKSRDTSEVKASTVKTCLFNTTELIMCSTNGWMIVVADLSEVLPSGHIPTGIHLQNSLCVPKEQAGTKVLFSLPLHSCGATVKLSKDNVTYQNKIYYYFGSGNSTEGVTVQCTYPVAGLYSLFAAYRFDSVKEGVGSITYTTEAHTSTSTPPPIPSTTVAPQTTKSPILYLPAFYPTARYIKVPSDFKPFGTAKKDTKGPFQVKQ